MVWQFIRRKIFLLFPCLNNNTDVCFQTVEGNLCVLCVEDLPFRLRQHLTVFRPNTAMELLSSWFGFMSNCLFDWEKGLCLLRSNMASGCRDPVPEASSFQSSDPWVGSDRSLSCTAPAAFWSLFHTTWSSETRSLHPTWDMGLHTPALPQVCHCCHSRLQHVPPCSDTAPAFFAGRSHMSPCMIPNFLQPSGWLASFPSFASLLPPCCCPPIRCSVPRGFSPLCEVSSPLCSPLWRRRSSAPLEESSYPRTAPPQLEAPAGAWWLEGALQMSRCHCSEASYPSLAGRALQLTPRSCRSAGTCLVGSLPLSSFHHWSFHGSHADECQYWRLQQAGSPQSCSHDWKEGADIGN